jgi:uncharacterized protein YgiB involved in biofilm formation
MEAPQEGVGIARPRRRRTCIADFGAAPVLNSPQDTGPETPQRSSATMMTPALLIFIIYEQMNFFRKFAHWRLLDPRNPVIFIGNDANCLGG